MKKIAKVFLMLLAVVTLISVFTYHTDVKADFCDVPPGHQKPPDTCPF